MNKSFARHFWFLIIQLMTLGSTSASSYYYDLKDYQGNVRMAVKSGSSSPFMTDYYPYGGVIRKGRIGTHHRLFIGKELDKMHGLNWYDFEARMYDPTLGRFMTMDPLAEKYYSVSPYVYCENNPVRFIDPTGMQKEEPEKNRNKSENKVIDNEQQNYIMRYEKPLESIHPEFYLITGLRAGENMFSMVSDASKKLVHGFNFVKEKVSDGLSCIWNSIRSNEKNNTFDDLLQNSDLVRQTKGNTKIYRKEGNGLEEFNSMHLDKVESFKTEFGKGYRGYDKNNIEYKYRPGSTSGEPTIEMIKNNRTKVKLRYDNK